MKKRLFTIFVATVLSLTCIVLAACGPVRKQGNIAKISQITVEQKDLGQFRILQLNDLHLTKGSSYIKDKQTLQWVSDAVDYSSPDLIIVGGDAVGGAYGRNNGLIELANLLESKKVYWAYVMGNHDGEWSEKTKTQLDPSDITGRLELYDILKAYKYSLMKYEESTVTYLENGVSVEKTLDGVGNYVIDLVNSDAAPQKLFSIVCMDSGGKYYDAEGVDKGYAGVSKTQVEWYKQQMALRSGVPSALFMHVPPSEFQTAWTDTSNPFIGNFSLINNESKCYGQNAEFNTGIYTAAKEAGASLIAVAHDHNFNWMKNYEGMLFSYGRCSGVNAWERTAPVGATIYDINLKTSYDPAKSNQYAAYTNGLYTVSVIEPEFAYQSYFN